MNDTKTTFDRIGWYRNTTLKTARVLVFAWLPLMALLLTATVFTHYATAQAEYRVAHSFNRVH